MVPVPIVVTTVLNVVDTACTPMVDKMEVVTVTIVVRVAGIVCVLQTGGASMQEQSVETKGTA